MSDSETRLLERIEMLLDQRPADYTIYKGKAAIQFSMLLPKRAKLTKRDGDPYYGTDKGCLFVAIAPSTGPKSYDWSQKITFKLNEHECGKLIRAMKGDSVELYHSLDKEGEKSSKTLKISLIETNNGKCLMALASEFRGESRMSHPSVPITQDESEVIISLVQTAVAKILGWR